MWIYGGGGHAKVVVECLQSTDTPIRGIFDDDPSVKSVHSIPVIGPYNPSLDSHIPLIIAVGDNVTRWKLAQKLQHPLGNAFHVSAIVSPSARVGQGTVIFHRSIVQAGCVIGNNGILNTAVTIDHDCYLQNGVHIAPGAILCGGVQVGQGTFIGAGATMLPGVSVGQWCVVGAGAVVTRSLPDFVVAVGVPARIVRTVSMEHRAQVPPQESSL